MMKPTRLRADRKSTALTLATIGITNPRGLSVRVTALKARRRRGRTTRRATGALVIPSIIVFILGPGLATATYAASGSAGALSAAPATSAAARRSAVSRRGTARGTPQQAINPGVSMSVVNVALLEAAGNGDSTKVLELLAGGADVNATVPGDGSALIAAARGRRDNGRIDVVTLLLDRGADVNLAVPGDGSPLIAAAQKGYLDVVTLLLDRGADVDRAVSEDENALIAASAAGRLDVVRLLVARGADVNARAQASIYQGAKGVGREWRTPLGMARRRNHTAIVQYLLSAGAATSAKSRPLTARPALTSYVCVRTNVDSWRRGPTFAWPQRRSR